MANMTKTGQAPVFGLGCKPLFGPRAHLTCLQSLTHPRLHTPRGSCCTQCTGPDQAKGGSWGRMSSGQLPGHGERDADGWRETNQEGMGAGGLALVHPQQVG